MRRHIGSYDLMIDQLPLSILSVTFPANNITVIAQIYLFSTTRSQFGGQQADVAAADGAGCGDHVVCDEHRIDFN